jgi:hypothetical protein
MPDQPISPAYRWTWIGPGSRAGSFDRSRSSFQRSKVGSLGFSLIIVESAGCPRAVSGGVSSMI